jgi:hypothetical protein
MACAWLLALAPVAGLAVNTVVQVAGCRWVWPRRLLRSLVAGFAAGLAAAGGLTVLAGAGLALPELGVQLLINLTTTAVLGYCYFHFVNLGQTARRVRILREFVEAGGTLSREEVLKRYNAREMIEQRLGRLLRTDQVVLREGRYFIGKATVLRMARAVEGLRHLLGMRRGDLTSPNPTL